MILTRSMHLSAFLRTSAIVGGLVVSQTRTYTGRFTEDDVSQCQRVCSWFSDEFPWSDEFPSLRL
jgi:hypothetical protein